MLICLNMNSKENINALKVSVFNPSGLSNEPLIVRALLFIL